MEQNNRFFVYDSFVFAFKNALANARIYTISYLTWLVAALPLIVIAGITHRTFFAIQLPTITKTNWAQLITGQLLQTSGLMILSCILIGLLLAAWITVGFVRIGLRIHDTGEAHWIDLFP